MFFRGNKSVNLNECSVGGPAKPRNPLSKSPPPRDDDSLDPAADRDTQDTHLDNALTQLMTRSPTVMASRHIWMFLQLSHFKDKLNADERGDQYEIDLGRGYHGNSDSDAEEIDAYARLKKMKGRGLRGGRTEGGGIRVD